MYRIKKVVPERSLPHAAREALLAVTTLYASCRNTLDPRSLIECLSPDVVMASQDTLDDLVGRDAVASFLIDCWAFLRSLPTPTGLVDVGEIDLPNGAGYPCGIFRMADDAVSLATLSMDLHGLITRIDILTVVPPPSAARVLVEAHDLCGSWTASRL
ncbi:hypothetical protein GAY28_03725 [Azospirillum brasilense]|nr:hypothetical protein [Azospirillum brasilense]